jgi:glycosyltransferase involved in cell wall biosynthesis
MPSPAEPLFSSIITTYNRAALLPRAMQSVLSQTCEDFELLVIDNGSTDATRDVVEAIRDARVRYLRNPQPTRSCDAPRNFGITQARGRYIGFLDDDDVWYPEKLARVRDAFAAHPEVAAVCHHENRRVNGQIDRLLRHGPWTERFFETLLYERNCLSSCAVTLRAEVLRALGGFVISEAIDGAADYDLWLRLAATGAKVHFLDEALGEFTVTGTNWSAVDPAFEARVAHLVTSHLLQYEGRPLSRVSSRGAWRLFQLHAIAGRAFQRSLGLRAALPEYLSALRFLLQRPSTVIRWLHMQQASG